MPQVHVFARVAPDVFELRLAHLPYGLGGHAHHQGSRGYHLVGRHHRPCPHLRVVLDDGAREHDGADADAHVVADGARVHHAAVTDGDALTDDAGKVRRDVEHGVVLHVGITSHADVVVLVTAHDGEGPDAHAFRELDVADDEGGGIDPGPRVDARHAAGHGADRHRDVCSITGSRAGSSATLSARLARATVCAGRAAITRAHAAASAMRASGATTAESRPMRSASSASTARPVSSMSRARPSGKRRASWTLEAIRPTFTPTAPSLARADPMRMSHQRASTSPPPIVQPLMAAITGCSNWRSARFTSAPRR